MEAPMTKGFWGWLGWFVFLFILDFWLPFTVLSRVPKITGSFLFWIVWGVVAIASMFIIFAKWREVEVETAADNGGTS